MRVGRIILSCIASLVLLPVLAWFGLMELATVDRSQCDWGTFDHICSDYEGTYGINAGIVLAAWALALWAINRRAAEEGK